MRSFAKELKRRRVYRVAIAYAVVASGLIQLGGTILPIFHARLWVQQLFIVLIVTGFPFALVLGWLYDITRTGIRRTPTAHGLRVYGRRQLWLVALVGTAIAALALAGYWWWQPWKKAEADPRGTDLSTKGIAVLPFQNLSPDNAGAFFADAVQDQILTNLAKVADLKVISHRSVEQYRGPLARNAREIGVQLGVAYLLEGTVQRAPGRVRVNAKLIDARADTQIWAESYESDVADLFVLQSDLAQAIVRQLQAKLSPQERGEIEERPTKDLTAFTLYQEAKEIVDEYLEIEDVGAALNRAVQLLEQAIGRDGNFVLAHCYLARAHNLLYFLDLDPSQRRRQLAEAAVARALELRPNSAEAHLARADHLFRCHRDYEAAQRELDLARPGLPNDVPLYNLSGYIHRRQGHWREAEREFGTAVRLDPRNPNAVNLLVDTFVLERRFAEARLAYDRAINAGMREPIALIRRAALDFGETGDPSTLKVALAAAPEVDVGGGETSLRVLIAMIERNYDEARRALAASPRGDFQDVDFSFYFPRPWYEAIIARAEGDPMRAAENFRAARVIFEERLQHKPNDPRTLAVLAQVDANLGDRELALRQAQDAVARMPVSRDAYDGPLVLQGLAQVYTWIGEHEKALEELERLVALPGYLSYGYLRTDPQWEPLRAHPRFQKLLAGMRPAGR
ncbi:MAG TPA: FlgO family outer membrane protein [Chthoniobacterales bacterium]|nr:FlgO family outer membrane protein [Chthoniobacterales bacterium]